MRYFPDSITSVEHLKRAYRELSMKHHPDRGGDPKAFIEMKVEYDHLLKLMESGASIESNINLIDDLVAHCKQQKYKPGWVYFKFMDIAQNATLKDFQYLADALGYARGWAYYKHREYEESKQ